jgi:hypothetical protein
VTLNCRPGQWAWIHVPQRPDFALFGLTQLRGCAVQVARVAPDAVPNPEVFTLPCSDPVGPVWLFQPAQVVIIPRSFFTLKHGIVPAGTRVRVEHWPDKWLRPFKDLPPEEIEQIEKECAL